MLKNQKRFMIGVFIGGMLGILGLSYYLKTYVPIYQLILGLFVAVFLGARIGLVSTVKQGAGMGTSIGTIVGLYLSYLLLKRASDIISADPITGMILVFLVGVGVMVVSGVILGTVVGAMLLFLTKSTASLPKLGILANQNRDRIRKWWKNQNTGIKTAIIGGIFSLVVVFCTLLGGIMTDYVSTYLTDSSKKSVKYPMYLNITWDRGQPEYENFTSVINGMKFGLVPTKCAVIDLGAYGQMSTNELDVLSRTQHRSFAFDIVTEQTLVISTGLVRVETYKPPPSDNLVSGDIDFYFDLGGMGEVPIVHFQEQTVDRSTEEAVVSLAGGSLRLDKGDAATFVFDVVFSDPGIYKLSFYIYSHADQGREIQFTSDAQAYGWLYVNDITQFTLREVRGAFPGKWMGNCQ